MKIEFVKLKRTYDRYAAEYEAAALRALRSGWYILGKEVSAFEEEFAAYTGGKYCVGLASGLDALWIAFRLLGIGEGDEVIVQGNTYIASVMGITMNGATPVFVEPDEHYGIDADKIEEKITERHRHRFEYNNEYKERLEKAGLICSGTSPDGTLVEIVENKNHPFFIAGQFHPEFKSRPNKCHPLFREFVAKAKKMAK